MNLSKNSIRRKAIIAAAFVLMGTSVAGHCDDASTDTSGQRMHKPVIIQTSTNSAPAPKK